MASVLQGDAGVERRGPRPRRHPALVALVDGARAEDPIPSAPAPAIAEAPETLKLSQSPSLRLTLAVMVDGRGPFEFLVDTGAERTVISRELAASLGLPRGHEVVRIREAGGVDDASTVLIDRLAIGNRVVRHIDAPGSGGRKRRGGRDAGYRRPAQSACGHGFKTMHMSSTPSRAEAVDTHTIVVHGKNRLGQLILTHSRIRGVPILVVVDSGSEVSFGNAPLLKLLTKRSLSLNPPATTQMVDVTGRKLIIEQDQIAEADVGGLVIYNMPLAFAALPIFDYLGLADIPTLFLGMDVLSHCERVSVDMRRREATFTLP